MNNQKLKITKNKNLISEPPKFEPMPSKKVVLENDNVTLCCNVSGNPQSLVLWYRLNNLTMPNGQKKILVEVNNSVKKN